MVIRSVMQKILVDMTIVFYLLSHSSAIVQINFVDDNDMI